MLKTKLFVLTLLAMTAFAANSLLCRLALKQSHIDPYTFTGIRLVSGAIMLWFISKNQNIKKKNTGNWISSLCLFSYAIFFSLSYISLPSGIGALILFGAVQITMISYGLLNGERFNLIQVIGLILAIFGLLILFLPGATSPSLEGSLMMSIAGISWALYSLRGRTSQSPLQDTAGNFLRSCVFVIFLTFLIHTNHSLDKLGIIYAIFSGAVASGLGYSIWYIILGKIKATSAATVQLSVPVITSFGAIIFLNEPITEKLIIASAAILGGISLVMTRKREK